MAFPHKLLNPSTAEIDGWVFENENIGLERGLFVSIRVEFAPVEYERENWNCSVCSEWIPFKGGSWLELENLEFNSPGIETSFYMVAHDWCENVCIKLTHIEGTRFKLAFSASVDFTGYMGEDENCQMPLEFETVAEFKGFTVNRDNLFPKPSTAQEATKVIAAFADISSFQAPTVNGSVFKFNPIVNGISRKSSKRTQ